MKFLQYDAVVIGAGQGGALAKHLAQAGKKTALIERRWLGGSCINWGCTPTKTMVTSARIAHLVRRAADFGIHTEPPHVNFSEIRQRKRDIVLDFRSGYQKSVGDVDNLDVLCGEASFCDAKTLQVDFNNGESQKLQAGTIIIATGTCATTPPIPGLNDSGYLTAETLMELESVPEHLIILGGGYIAAEFAQMFRRFGAEVTILQRDEQLLTREDRDIANAIAEIFTNEGINILYNAEASLIQRDGKVLSVIVETESGQKEITGSHLLLAVGQTPNTKSLRPERAGIKTNDNSYIIVNDSLATSVPGIFALGDVKGGPAFTHIAYDDTRILRANLLENRSETIADRIVPYVLFTDPQLGRVGMTEKAAREAGFDIRVAKLPLEDTARALQTNETGGFLKAIVNNANDQILGCAILAAAGGEVMPTIQVTMQAKLPYTTLRDGIFAHPTQVESLNNLFLKMDRE